MDVSSFKFSKATSERALVLEDFLRELEEEREEHPQYWDKKAKKWKFIQPMRPSRLGAKLAHLSIADLRFFWDRCKRYQKEKGSFSKCFHGALKIK